MKFLQIQPLYNSFLSQVYTNNVSLHNQSYDYQHAEILSHKFSSSHFLCDELSVQGLKTDCIFPNAQSLQSRWAIEHSISGQNVLLEQIEQFRPDILYIIGAVGGLDSSLLRKLSYKPKLTIGWLGSNIPPKTDWSMFDCILSGLFELRNTALKLGAKNTFEFYPGMQREIFDHFSVSNKKPNFDVVFVGQCNPVQHQRRSEYLEFLGNQEFQLGLFLSGDISHLSDNLREKNNTAQFGFEMLKTIYDAKISFDCRADHSFLKRDIGKDHTVNMRIFETTAVGSLLLTEDYANLSKLFIKKEEIDTFQNKADLIKKINYYLSNQESRENVARNGWIKCRKEHSISNRAKQFLDIIEILLNNK